MKFVNNIPSVYRPRILVYQYYNAATTNWNDQNDVYSALFGSARYQFHVTLFSYSSGALQLHNLAMAEKMFIAMGCSRDDDTRIPVATLDRTTEGSSISTDYSMLVTNGSGATTATFTTDLSKYIFTNLNGSAMTYTMILPNNNLYVAGTNVTEISNMTFDSSGGRFHGQVQKEDTGNITNVNNLSVTYTGASSVVASRSVTNVNHQELWFTGTTGTAKFTISDLNASTVYSAFVDGVFQTNITTSSGGFLNCTLTSLSGTHRLDLIEGAYSGPVGVLAFTSSPITTLVYPNHYLYTATTNHSATFAKDTCNATWISVGSPNGTVYGEPPHYSAGVWYYSVSIKATNGFYTPSDVWQNYTIIYTIVAVPEFHITSTPITTVTNPNLYQYHATANISVTWSLDSGPYWIFVSSGTGWVSGVPPTVSSATGYSIYVRATNNSCSPNNAWQNYTLTVNPYFVFTSTPVTTVSNPHHYFYNVTTSVTAEFYVWGNATWLFYNNITGHISGTPPNVTHPTTYSLYITATASGIDIYQNFTLTVNPSSDKGIWGPSGGRIEIFGVEVGGVILSLAMIALTSSIGLFILYGFNRFGSKGRG